MISLISFQTLGVAAAISVLYAISLVVYRLFLHPLARFPGPKLAAVAQWYEIYYDVIRDGSFIWQIERMHEQYGPVVRINPNELHIKDSDFFGTIYSGPSRKRDKDETWAMMAGAPQSAFSTPEHEVHKIRRSALNPFFSKRTVSKLEPRIASKVDTLCQRLGEFVGSDHVVGMQVAASAFTMDVISEYCYGEEGCSNFLLDKDFKPEWAECMQDVFDNAAFRRSVPWLTTSLQKLPVEYMLKLVPSMGTLIRWQATLKQQVKAVVDEYHASHRKEKKETIFHSLLGNEDLPPQEKTLGRLADEAEILVAAGSETTARTISYTTVYILSTPGVLGKLREELRAAMPDKTVLLAWTELEKLPYLTGIVREGLRLTFGVTTRSPRVPHEAVQYGKWLIPARTPIASTTYFVSTDPGIFPDPLAFKPERWAKTEDGLRLDRYMTNFSKGTRGCVGINLAYSELYLVLAALFRRFDLELYDTTTEDVRFVRDKFVAGPPKTSKGVRVLIKGELD